MKIDDNLLAVGSIVKAHGIKGGFKMLPYSGSPEGMQAYPEIYLEQGDGTIDGPYCVQRCCQQGRYALFELRGITDRTVAEALRGKTVYVDKKELPVAEDNEIYLHELEGKRVETVDGVPLGYVHGFLMANGNDLMVVQDTQGQEVLIPIGDEFLHEMNEQVIRVSLPPGFLDINR